VSYKKWELIYLSQAPEFTPIIWWEPMLLIVVVFVLSHYVSLRSKFRVMMSVAELMSYLHKTSSCLLQSSCLIYIKTSSCLLQSSCLIYIKTSSCLLQSSCLIYVICVCLRIVVFLGLYVFVLHAQCLTVYLDCQFMISLSFFSNVYFQSRVHR
jgi:hypothetical protein